MTGVDLVVDDTPEAIIVSSHDPVRREVARIALSKLVQDGRIHPARIEKEVEKAQEEVERAIREAGDEAAYQTGFQGLHPEILKLVGRLKYRTSYGQNQFYHAIETSHLAGLLAAELHGDVRAAKMGGLLHDLGKAVSHEVEGPHALVGAEIAQRYGVPEKVVNIIASHHGETEPQSLEAILVASATPSPAPAPAPAVNHWRATSSDCRRWKISPRDSKACSRLLPSRPAAKCASSSSRRLLTILLVWSSHARLPRRSRTACNIRVRSRLRSFVIRCSVEYAK